MIEHLTHFFVPGTEENIALMATLPFLHALKNWGLQYFNR